MSDAKKEDDTAVNGDKGDEETDDKDEENNTSTHDPYFPPIITLPEVVVDSGEKEEEEVIKLRAKLYRYAHESEPPEWKERGTGEAKILKHLENQTARILMRRDKTLKICANHFIRPWMELKPNCGSEKAWIWKVQADYADEEPKPETLAIKFGSKENAQKWESAFAKTSKWVLECEAAKILAEEVGEEEEDDEVAEKETEETKPETDVVDKMGDMTVQDAKKNIEF